MWSKRERATLEDVVELLQDLAVILMKIDAKLEEIVAHIDGDDEEEADA